jgi:dTDP-4-dehydrorhamnose 3,5-epimerase
MFKLEQTAISGCYIIKPTVTSDERGNFVKVYHDGEYMDYNLQFTMKEQYYSTSKRDVIRGLHFQAPPDDHVKLVYCTNGHVLDIILDIRNGSPTYGRHVAVTLNSEHRYLIYIPKGLAHGFSVLSEEATMVYNLSTVYAPSNDRGIRWDSADIAWPTRSPIISERDKAFPLFKDFESPFYYEQ